MKKLIFIGWMIFSSQVYAGPQESFLCSARVSVDALNGRLDEAYPITMRRSANKNLMGGYDYETFVIRGPTHYKFIAQSQSHMVDGVEQIGVNSYIAKIENNAIVGSPVEGGRVLLQFELYESYFGKDEASISCVELEAPPPPVIQ